MIDMTNKFWGAAVLCCLAPVAQAAMPNITISYIQPKGIVSTNESIDMWVRVASDRVLDTALGAPFGFDLEDLPTTAAGYDEINQQWAQYAFASYTGITIYPSFSCVQGCAPSGYKFVPALTSEPAKPAFFTFWGNALRTGDYWVGTFVPTASEVPGTRASAHVAPGEYSFSLNPGLQFSIQGLSAEGKSLNADFGTKGMYSTCGYLDTDVCRFQRTVVAVPEPTSLMYALLGMAGVTSLAYRRKTAAAIRTKNRAP